MSNGMKRPRRRIILIEALPFMAPFAAGLFGLYRMCSAGISWPLSIGIMLLIVAGYAFWVWLMWWAGHGLTWLLDAVVARLPHRAGTILWYACLPVYFSFYLSTWVACWLVGLWAGQVAVSRLHT